MNEEVNRREFDSLQSRVAELVHRLTWLDEHGTRGISALTIQQSTFSQNLSDFKAEIARDLGELKASTETWQRAHLTQHRDDEVARKSSKRWLVASVLIPTLAIIVGVITVIAIIGTAR